MAAEVNKPDFSYQWSSGGSIVAPSNAKIQTGWTAEVPPYQWENWSQNRQDNAILHLFQKGVSEWDAASNYYFTTSGVRSYVQGSNGLIYVAKADSINQNPVTDTSNTYWKVAFADNSLFAPGDIKISAYSTPDAGFLKTNGSAISRTTYAALFAKIGTSFGVGDGSTTFNVPDTRANFVRGWADNSAVDAGRVFGSYQDGTIVCAGDPSLSSAIVLSFFNSVDDSLPNHVARLGGDGVPAALTGVQSTSIVATAANTGLESAMYTRPRNIALSYFIKF